MNEKEALESLLDFLETMCPEKYKQEFKHCMETNNAKRAEEIIDEINSLG